MKQKHLALLEKYFNGEMSREEISAFEVQMAADADLLKDFREYQQILEALQDKDVIELRSKLKGITEGDSRQNGNPRFLDGKGNWMWLAALILVMVSFAIVTINLVREINKKEKIIASYLGVDKDEKSALDRELEKYGMRNHGQVILMPSDTSNMIVDGDLYFSWTLDSAYSLLLDVINKDGKVVFESYRPIQSPYIFRNNLKAGFYVFRFRNDKETFSLTVRYMK